MCGSWRGKWERLYNLYCCMCLWNEGSCCWWWGREAGGCHVEVGRRRLLKGRGRGGRRGR